MTRAASISSILLLFALTVTFLTIHQVFRTTPVATAPSTIIVEFNPQWKDIALKLLEKVRTGQALSEVEKAILAQMYLNCRNGGYPAELEHLVEELMTLIEMVFDIHDQIVRDEGEQHTDRTPIPDGR